MEKMKALKDDAVRKTLSRNEMYTPLVAYEQAKANSKADPTKYMSNKNSVPKQLQESTLVSFLESISKKYHRRYATAKDAKNTGSRPISLSDMEGRVIRRAVTLLGHGINSSIATTKKSGNDETEKQKRPRKKRSWNEIQGPLKGSTSEPSTKNPPTPLVFLQQLNQAWNRYIKSIILPLENGSKDVALEDRDAMNRWSRAIHKRLGKSREKLELAGAHVQVNQCAEKKSLSGRHGIMIQETKNTWTVACMTTRSKMESRRRVKKRKSQNNSDESNESGQDGDNTALSAITELIVVPKRGSTLDLVVPLEMSDDKIEGVNASASASRSAPEEWILPHATNSIYITLTPDLIENASAGVGIRT